MPIHEEEEPANPLAGSVLFEEDLIPPIDEQWNAES